MHLIKKVKTKQILWFISVSAMLQIIALAGILNIFLISYLHFIAVVKITNGIIFLIKNIYSKNSSQIRIHSEPDKSGMETLSAQYCVGQDCKLRETSTGILNGK